jgi:DNA-directed RNA polymerase omega subunit
MAQTVDPQDQADASPASATDTTPITSRFLFVDVAAQRAKQLRRGALARLERTSTTPHKLERIAMEEVRSGLIQYALPTNYDGPGVAKTIKA